MNKYGNRIDNLKIKQLSKNCVKINVQIKIKCGAKIVLNTDHENYKDFKVSNCYFFFNCK